MIRLLVIAPRLQQRLRLKDLLADDPGVAVVGEARSPDEAERQISQLHPDVALCIEETPGERLAALVPLIVLVEAPEASLSPGYAEGGVRVVPHPDCGGPDARVALRHAIQLAWESAPVPLETGPGGRHILAIGASTGGPQALMALLQRLPPGLGLSILIVQHMAKGFVENFAGWLDRESPIAVRLARGGERLVPDLALIAPGDRHMRLRGDRVELCDDPPKHSCRPSVDVLFESLAREHAPATVAVLLTGIGRDGAQGMAALRRRGGYTIAQDEASSVVFGMPRAAIALEGADEVLPLTAIPAALLRQFDIGVEI